MRSWIDERRDDLVLHRRLAAAVKEWHESEWKPAYLFSGGRLEHYEAFAEETDLALTAPEKGFLDASREAEDAAVAGRRRRRLGVLAVLASAAVIAAVLAIVAFLAQRSAEDASAEAQTNAELAGEQAQLAKEQTELALEQTELALEQTAVAEEQAALSRARELASEARVAFNDDPELAILLALEAVSVPVDGGPLKEAVEALHSTVAESRARLTVPGYLSASIDATGSRLLSAAHGEGISLYDTATGAILLTLPVPAGLPEAGGLRDEDFFGEIALAVGSDGTRLATGRTDGTISLWDAMSGDELATTNDVQTISVNAGGGTFTLAYGESITNPLSVDSSEAEIEAELEALSEVDDVAVAGTGTSADPWQVTFLEIASPYIRRLDGAGTVVADVFGGFAEISVDADSGTFVFLLDDALSEPVAADATAEQIEVALEELSGMPDVLVSGEAGFFELGAVDDGVLLPAFTAESVDLSAVTVLGRGHDYLGESVWSFDGVEMIEFSRDGRLLVSRSFDQTIRVWDATTLEQLTVIDFWIGQYAFWGMALNADGTRRLPAASADGTRVWDTRTGELLHELFSESSMNAWNVDFFPDGNRLAVAYVDPERGLGIWDLETQTEYPVFGQGWLRTVSVSADGSLIAAGDDGGTIHLAEPTESGAVYLYTLEGHRNRLMDSSFADEGFVLTSVSDQTARIWDLGNGGTAEWLTLAGEAWSIPSIAYSPDGSLLVRGPVGLNIVVADAITGEEVAVLDIASPEVPDMTFSPDGSLLAAGAHGESGAVLVWDTANWDLVANLAPPAEEDADGFAWSVDFSPDGARLAATVEGQVEMWDTSTWEKTNTLAVADPDQGGYKELAFRPGGNELAVRGTVFLTEKERWDDAVEIYDLDGNYLRTCCQHLWFLYAASVTYSPDGSQILTAGIDFDTGEGTVFTWDADSGGELRSFHGHDDVAWDAVFSPDGSLIAASGDPDVRISGCRQW